jgi:hypothetical protein
VTNPTAATTAQHLMTGMTIGGGTLEWMTVNSSAVTAIAVCLTAVTSIALGIWNARTNTINATANVERNRINKRDILEDSLNKIRASGASEDYITELLRKIRDDS